MTKGKYRRRIKEPTTMPKPEKAKADEKNRKVQRSTVNSIASGQYPTANWKLAEPFHDGRGFRTTINTAYPSRYADYRTLWPDPAIDYPWRRNLLNLGKSHTTPGVTPNPHAEYILILRTLEHLGGRIEDKTSAANKLRESSPIEIPPMVMSSRLTELDVATNSKRGGLGYIRSEKLSPDARRRRAIELTDAGRKALENPYIPTWDELVEAVGPTPLETEVNEDVVESQGTVQGEPERPEGGESGSLPPPPRPPAIAEASPSARDIADEMLAIVAELITNPPVQEDPALRLQLAESQRQLERLRIEHQKIANQNVEYRRQRDTAMAQVVELQRQLNDANRNLEEVLLSARNNRQPSQAVQEASLAVTRRLMEKPSKASGSS